MCYLRPLSVFKSFCLFFISGTFILGSASTFGQDLNAETTRNASKSISQASSEKISQEKNTLSLDNDPSLFFILDSIRHPNKQTVAIFDDSPNYFQMENGEAIITGRHRGKSFFHQGNIEGLEQITDSNGNAVIRFYMVGSEFSNGKIASYEITLFADGSALVHQFVKLDNKVDVYYVSHKASTSEVQAIRDYWKGN